MVKLNVKLSCGMDFTDYPHDTQVMYRYVMTQRWEKDILKYQSYVEIFIWCLMCTRCVLWWSSLCPTQRTTLFSSGTSPILSMSVLRFNSLRSWPKCVVFRKKKVFSVLFLLSILTTSSNWSTRKRKIAQLSTAPAHSLVLQLCSRWGGTQVRSRNIVQEE